MTNPSITNSSGITFTFNEGDIQTIVSKVNGNLDFDAMPGFTPDASILYDFNGVLKTITLTGEIQNTSNNTLSSGTAITIDAQRKWLEQTLDGAQSGSTFISNYSSVYNGSTWSDARIYFSDLTFTEDSNKPNILGLTLKLFVGDV